MTKSGCFIKRGVKGVSIFSMLAMVLNLSLAGVFFIASPTAEAVDEEICAAEVDVVLVIDKSGSMGAQSGDPSSLDKAKEASVNFLANLDLSNDRSALVSYSTYALLDQGLTYTRSETESAINSLVASGNTNIGDAISLATDELKDSGRIEANKVIVLLTDGLANEPFGFSLNSSWNYPIEKAEEASTEGYKIYTIKLGEIDDEGLMEEIAEITGGQYYTAPTSDDLAGIYELINGAVCGLGSISGCKYLDTDPNDDGLTGSDKIEGWEIVLKDASGAEVDSATTNTDGCYFFNNLDPGNYVVSEGEGPTDGDYSGSYKQTWPENTVYDDIGIVNGDIFEDKDFGNYFPICGNEIVDEGEECDDGDQGSDICSTECVLLEEECNYLIYGYKFNGQERLNDWEMQLRIDGPEGEVIESTNTYTDVSQGKGFFKFEELCSGTYYLNEVEQSGYEQVCPYSPPSNPYNYYEITLPNENTDGYDFNNHEKEIPADCGNGLPNEGEGCDDGVVENGVECTPEYGTNKGDGDCTWCTKTCEQSVIAGPYCGDDVRDDDEEECDGSDGVGVDQTCTDDCTLVDLYCGDNNLDTDRGELCDDGDELNGKIPEVPYGGDPEQYCTNDCQIATVNGGICGDNKVNGEEQCDGSAGIEEGEICSSNCTIENSGTRPVCGNSIKEDGEECDDGNDWDNDGCDHLCQLETSGGGGSGFYPKYTNQGSTADEGSEPTGGEPVVLGEEGAPQLVIEKSVNPSVANQGDKNIEFKIVVTNNGNLTAFGVEVTDIIPADFSFVEESDTVVIASTGGEGLTPTNLALGENGSITKTWDLGDVESGQIQTLTYRVSINDDAEARVYNDPAKAIATNHDEVQDSASLEVKSIKVLSETGVNGYEFILLGFMSSVAWGSAFALKRKQIA